MRPGINEDCQQWITTAPQENLAVHFLAQQGWSLYEVGQIYPFLYSPGFKLTLP